MNNKGLIIAGSVLFVALLFSFDYSKKEVKSIEPVKPKKVIL